MRVGCRILDNAEERSTSCGINISNRHKAIGMKESIRLNRINDTSLVHRLAKQVISDLTFTLKDKFRGEALVYGRLHLFILQGGKNSVEIISLKDWNVKRLQAFLAKPCASGVELSAPAIVPNMEVNNLYITYTIAPELSFEETATAILQG